MTVRKNQATLTAQEKSRFVAAIKALKRSGMYDHHVRDHMTAVLSIRPNPAHQGPAFFPWHRYCLYVFERELQMVDPGVTIPYWDWTRDSSPTSSIWAADFMGGNGRSTDLQVMTGPFAYSTGEWTLTVRDNNRTPPFLRRSFGVLQSSLPTATQAARSLGLTPYDAAPWNSTTSNGYRMFSEAPIHNVVHRWLGGTMFQASSPGDPVFWLHHCMIDRLWAMWQRRNPNQRYVPASGGPSGHNLNDPMWPWTTQASPPTPASVLDYRALGYTYDDEGTW